MRLLLVEDEPGITAFLIRALVAEGYRVETASDGAAALERVLGFDYELVLLDLGLPGRDEFELLAQIRRSRPGLRVVVLSSRAELSTKLRAFELGAVDYVCRPFSLAELLARVRVHVSRDTAPPALTLQAGPLLLDLARRQARCGHSVADLTDREFRLLHCLLLHAGEVISRQRLLAEVWGYDFDPHSNVVDVCIRRLRRTLGPDAPIDTVRNAGYRVALDRPLGALNGRVDAAGSAPLLEDSAPGAP